MANPFCDLDKLEEAIKQYGDGRKGLEAMAWANLDVASNFYHVTPLRNVSQIMSRGLRGKTKGKMDRGHHPVIWFFVDDATNNIANMPSAVAYSLALYWLASGDLAGKKDFAILKIDSSVIERQYVLWDDVGEACAIACYGYSTGKDRLTIHSKHIELIETRPIPSDWLSYSPSQTSGDVTNHVPHLRASK